MNLQVLKRSRREPVPGDVFVYRIKDEPFGYGRVIRTDTKIGDFSNPCLLYVYDAFSEAKERIPTLNCRKLLIPPLATNRRPWTMGYFETITNRPLDSKDVLAVHCFWDEFTDCYRDEYGKRLHRRLKPCGTFALDSYRTIDGQVSIALGIEPAANTLPEA